MEFLEAVHQLVWGPWTLAIFLGTGLVFCVRGRFFALRKCSFWWSQTVGSLRESSKKMENGHGVNAAETVCTALAATVGTGNIAGVATALVAGGPGAIFWMWISAFIGMGTAYAETSLGFSWRKKGADGHYLCGPYLYMEEGLHARWLGIFYALLCLLAALGMGSMVQANSAIETLSYGFRIPKELGSLVLAVLVMLVVLGGVKRIGKVAQRLMPLASGIYIAACVAVLLLRADQIAGAVRAIAVGAFSPQAAIGGAAGYGICTSLRYGMARGVFSNEAGLGTLAILHGATEDTTPQKQGMWAMFEVFFDTVVLCTLTALVILCVAGSDLFSVGISGAALAAFCFESCLGVFGEMFLPVAMAVFAFATMIAWFYMGRQAAVYLEEKCGGAHLLSRLYPLLFAAAVFFGGMARLELVWILSDLVNGLMAFPNLTALLFLAPSVKFPEKDILHTKKRATRRDNTLFDKREES